MQKPFLFALLSILLLFSACSEPDLRYDCASDSDCLDGLVCVERLCLVKNDCPDGMTKCGDLCVNISSDIDHCGSCEPCPALDNANATACVQGNCTYECDGGWTDQDEDLFQGIAGSGCECPPNSSCACETDCSAPEPTCDENTVVAHTGPGVVLDDCTCNFDNVMTRTECGDKEICAGGSCVDVSCTEDEHCEVQDPFCDEEGLLVRWIGESTCGPDNTCQNESIRERCGDQQICRSGACVDVECTSPEHCEHPEPVCLGNVLSYHDAETPPVCTQNNTCTSTNAMREMDCTENDQVCQGGACVDLCENVECPLSNECQDNLLISTVSSTCDWRTGECVSEATVSNCEDFQRMCQDGTCVDLCEDVVCELPPNECRGSVLITHNSPHCDWETGDCSHIATESDCNDFQKVCDQGQCATAFAGTVQIPAGNFTMGNDDGRTDEAPSRVFYLSKYYIDETEVTVQEYAHCVSVGVCALPEEGNGFNWGTEGRLQHPINGVNWYDAHTYCEWIGGRLPTEAEWAKAARGTLGNMYPWGNDGISCERTALAECMGISQTTPVGSKPLGASPYGVLDAYGNVHEWVADWYSETSYRSNPLTNPQGPEMGTEKVVRGLSIVGVAIQFLPTITARFQNDPQSRGPYTGFRCVRDPQTN